MSGNAHRLVRLARMTLLALAAVLGIALLAMQRSVLAQGTSRELAVDGDVGALAWSPDGRKIAVGLGLNVRVGVLDAETGKMLWELRTDFLGPRSVAFSPDGAYVVTPTTTAERSRGGAALDLLDAQTGKPVRQVRSIYRDRDPQFNIADKFVVSPSARALAVLMPSRPGDPAVIYSTDSWQEVQRLSYERDILRTVAISGDGRQLAFGTVGGSIVLFDLASGTLERVIEAYRSGSVVALTFSPDGKFLASGAFFMNERHAEPDPIRVWRVEDGIKVRSRAANFWMIFALAWSPDGRYVVWASEDTSVYLWDVNSAEAPETIATFMRPSHAVAFSPDGRELAIGGALELVIKKMRQ